jgi:hypothetical protein
MIYSPRYYFPLTMINKIIGNTKQGERHTKKLAFLYDIGCNIEKGIIRVSETYGYPSGL